MCEYTFAYSYSFLSVYVDVYIRITYGNLHVGLNWNMCVCLCHYIYMYMFLRASRPMAYVVYSDIACGYVLKDTHMRMHVDTQMSIVTTSFRYPSNCMHTSICMYVYIYIPKHWQTHTTKSIYLVCVYIYMYVCIPTHVCLSVRTDGWTDRKVDG